MERVVKKIKGVNSKVRPLVAFSVILLFLVLLLSTIRASIFGHVVEPHEHMIFEIVFLILLAILAESVVFYFKQPTVLILMLLGVVMGPSFLELAWPAIQHYLSFLPETTPIVLQNPELVSLFATLGAIILMFKVGLHSSIHKIFTTRNFIVAALGIVFPFAAGYWFAVSSGGGTTYALFLGAALSATSVGVTVAILKEFKLIEKDFAQTIIGAAVIDDILCLLVLSLVINMPETLALEAIYPTLGILFSAIIFLIGGSLVGKYFVHKRIDRAGLDNKTFLYVLSFVFLYAYIAEFIGLSSIVGAFLAGVLLNYSKHVKEIEIRSTSLELLFTPVFFISLGMLVDVSAIFTLAVPILVISLLAMLTKLIGCGIGSLLTGLDKLRSSLVGVGMSPRGEVALIVALIGLQHGALTASEYTIITAMAFLTTIVVPPIMSGLLRKMK